MHVYASVVKPVGVPEDEPPDAQQPGVPPAYAQQHSGTTLERQPSNKRRTTKESSLALLVLRASSRGTPYTWYDSAFTTLFHHVVAASVQQQQQQLFVVYRETPSCLSTTAVPFWGQTTYILSGLSPKLDSAVLKGVITASCGSSIDVQIIDFPLP